MQEKPEVHCPESANVSSYHLSRSPGFGHLHLNTVRPHNNGGSCKLDEDVTRVIDIVLNCVLIYLISAFGIVGNSLNIAVLVQHGFQEPTNIILVSLSISDLVFTLSAPVSKLRCIVSLFDEALSITVHTFVTLTLFFPKYLCLATSFAYVAVIAIERFVAVFFPFHVSKIFKKRVTKFLVATIPLTAIIAMIPTFLTLEYEWVFDFSVNRTVAVLKYTDFYLNNEQLIHAYTWVGLNNSFAGTSIAIVTICCIAIGLKLMRAAMKREQLTHRATGYDIKVVKMLITVCVVYLAVSIPTITTYAYFVPDFIISSPMHQFMDNISVILYTFNASVNFIVYVSMSKKFAATYRRLLACKGSGKERITSVRS